MYSVSELAYTTQCQACAIAFKQNEKSFSVTLKNIFTSSRFLMSDIYICSFLHYYSSVIYIWQCHLIHSISDSIYTVQWVCMNRMIFIQQGVTWNKYTASQHSVNDSIYTQFSVQFTWQQIFITYVNDISFSVTWVVIQAEVLSRGLNPSASFEAPSSRSWDHSTSVD
jgi:hypothetical protein